MPIVTTVLHPENSADTDLYPRTNASQVTDFLDKTYPVNSIFMSVDSTSPASLFGGTWTQIQNGFLLSAGYDSISAGTTGGSKTHSHNVNDAYALLSLYNSTTYFVDKVISYTANVKIDGLSNKGSTSTSPTNGISLGGNTSATNHLPPYLAVYMWKRVA